jgi:hypothetical protein
MIKLEITDAELMSPAHLMAAATFLVSIAGHESPFVAEPAQEVVQPSWGARPVPMPSPHFETPMPHNSSIPLMPPLAPETLTAKLTPQTILGNPNPIDRSVTYEALGIPNPRDIAEVTKPEALELDADGLPWDARIHSRGASKMTNGRWKRRREVDPKLVRQVTAELRNAITITHSGAVNEIEEDFLPEEPKAAFNIPKPPSPAIPPPPPVEVDATKYANSMEDDEKEITYPELMDTILNLINNQKITHTQVIDIVKSLGGQSIPAIATRKELFKPTLDAIMEVVNDV